MKLPVEKPILNFVRRVSVFLSAVVIAWFLIIFIVANLPGGLPGFLRHNSNIPQGVARVGDSSMLRFREIADYHDIDILFIGSSHCYRSFDPRIFAHYNLNIFNMGSTSQSPLNSYYLMQEYLIRLNPKLIVIELYPVVLCGDGVESSLDLLANLSISWNLVKMALSTRNIIALNALLLKLFDFSHNPISSMRANLPATDNYVSGGFVEHIAASEVNRDFVHKKPRLNNRQLDYLSKIIKIARSKSIQVLLVIQPVPIEHKSAIENYYDLHSAISDFAEDEGVTFIDFNDSLKFDTEIDFYDADHLTQEGVRIFDELLIETIARDFGSLY